MNERQNQTMQLKRRKPSQNINTNNTNQNQNRQMHQGKLQQHVIQHKTVHISQRVKTTKDQLHRQTCDTKDNNT